MQEMKKVIDKIEQMFYSVFRTSVLQEKEISDGKR